MEKEKPPAREQNKTLEQELDVLKKEVIEAKQQFEKFRLEIINLNKETIVELKATRDFCRQYENTIRMILQEQQAFKN